MISNDHYTVKNRVNSCNHGDVTIVKSQPPQPSPSITATITLPLSPPQLKEPPQLPQNIRVIAKYYTRIHLSRLAELLDLSSDETEESLSNLVVSHTVSAKIDRSCKNFHFSSFYYIFLKFYFLFILILFFNIKSNKIQWLLDFFPQFQFYILQYYNVIHFCDVSKFIATHPSVYERQRRSSSGVTE